MTVSPHRAGALAIGLVCLAGCSNLPREAALPLPTAAAASAPVPLRGPHGRLSPAQSRAVMARLQHDMPETDIFGRHLAVEDTLVDIPLTTGNAVRLLQDGPATYAAMFAAIDGAHDHIHLETYILDDDAIGRRFARVLKAKQAAGVQVVVIRDSAGTFGTPAAFFADLAAGGIRVLEFNPLNPFIGHLPWAWNRRDHRKLLIVDGRTAFLGGINISSVYSGGSARAKARARAPDGEASAAGTAEGDDPALAWRDTDLQLDGPVVADFQKMFLDTWAAQHGPPLPVRDWYPSPVRAGTEVVRAIGSAPDEPFSLIYATLLSAVASAETSIAITVAYFTPDPQLLDGLEAAAARGVEVRLILPGRTDSRLALHAGHRAYDRLLRAGVHIHERRGMILHAKTALIDGVWSTVGSTNLDWRSFLHNQEVNAVVLGVDFGRQVQAMFDSDLAESDTITLAAWTQRGLGPRLMEAFAGLWAYWL